MKLTLVQLRNAVVIAYSLIVMATNFPGFDFVSKLIVIPYLLLVPGYFVASLLDKSGTLLDRVFYTLAWSVAVFGAVYSISTIVPSGFFPIDLVIPVITILLLAYDYFHRPIQGNK